MTTSHSIVISEKIAPNLRIQTGHIDNALPVIGAVGSIISGDASAAQPGGASAASAQPAGGLLSFIRKAKLATYASQGDSASVIPALPDSHQLEYREGDYFYRDIYFGMDAFTGQEVIYQAGKAVWSMAYSGGLNPHGNGASAGEIYGFLHQALLNSPRDLPLRGPKHYQSPGLRYRCDVEGDITHFHGVEQIMRDGALAYQLRFVGGQLQA